MGTLIVSLLCGFNNDKIIHVIFRSDMALTWCTCVLFICGLPKAVRDFRDKGHVLLKKNINPKASRETDTLKHMEPSDNRQILSNTAKPVGNLDVSLKYTYIYICKEYII